MGIFFQVLESQYLGERFPILKEKIHCIDKGHAMEARGGVFILFKQTN